MKNSSTADVEQPLTPDEREPSAELQQELGDVLHQRRLDVPLVRFVAKAQEVEAVRVLQRLMGEVRVRLGQLPLEIRDGLACTLDGTKVDVVVEHVARPAVLQRCARVGEALVAGFQPGQEDNIVAPRQFANRLLAN